VTTFPRIFTGALLWAVGLAACVRTPPVRYYTLTPGGSVGPMPARPTRYTVQVSPTSVPETLDRPELVLRVSASELAIDDEHHWAESLRSGISRAVAGDLALELEVDGALVVLADQGPIHPTDVEVGVDVQRLDANIGEGVTVDALWTARWTDGRASRAGRSIAGAPAARAGGFDALVAACAKALASVSHEIAQSIRADAGPHR
jgi:uncharacterized lipoprotein YmbA